MNRLIRVAAAFAAVAAFTFAGAVTGAHATGATAQIGCVGPAELDAYGNVYGSAATNPSEPLLVGHTASTVNIKVGDLPFNTTGKVYPFTLPPDFKAGSDVYFAIEPLVNAPNGIHHTTVLATEQPCETTTTPPPTTPPTTQPPTTPPTTAAGQGTLHGQGNCNEFVVQNIGGRTEHVVVDLTGAAPVALDLTPGQGHSFRLAVGQTATIRTSPDFVVAGVSTWTAKDCTATTSSTLPKTGGSPSAPAILALVLVGLGSITVVLVRRSAA